MLSTESAPFPDAPENDILPFSSRALVCGLPMSCSSAASFKSDLPVLPLLTVRFEIISRLPHSNGTSVNTAGF